MLEKNKEPGFLSKTVNPYQSQLCRSLALTSDLPIWYKSNRKSINITLLVALFQRNSIQSAAFIAKYETELITFVIT